MKCFQCVIVEFRGKSRTCDCSQVLTLRDRVAQTIASVAKEEEARPFEAIVPAKGKLGRPRAREDARAKQMRKIAAMAYARKKAMRKSPTPPSPYLEVGVRSQGSRGQGV